MLHACPIFSHVPGGQYVWQHSEALRLGRGRSNNDYFAIKGYEQLALPGINMRHLHKYSRIHSLSLIAGDQEGNFSHPRRMYANPQNPRRCVILLIALYVMVTASFKDKNRAAGAPPLFFINAEADHRYRNWISTIAHKQELLDKLKSRGIHLNPDKIGM